MGGEGPKKVSTLTKDQNALLSQILGGGAQAFPAGMQALLAQLDPEASREQFQKSVADPAIREFQGSVIPSILQGASNVGAKGGSAIDRQLAQAGSQLEQGLSEQFAGMQAGQQQAGIQNLLSLLFGGVGQEAFAIQPGRPGFAQTLVGEGLGAAGKAAGARFGRPS